MSFGASYRLLRTARRACVAIAIAAVLSLLTLTPAVPLLQRAVVHADTTLFATGFESGNPQPTWSDQSDTSGAGIVNVGGFCCSLTAPQLNVRNEIAHAGSAALMYSGSVTTTSGGHYAYLKAFDLSGQNITISSNTTLSYWIYPQSHSANSNVSGTNSTCVAIDMVFSDGSTLRDSGNVDLNGVPLHPAAQCGHLTLDTWNLLTSVIGGYLSGKTINRIDVGFDGASSVGGYHGYIDDIQLANLNSPPIIPAQYIAKLYTEGLGRAPDQSGWASSVSYFQANGCSVGTLSARGQFVYTSPEFTGDYSDNAARVLTLYRGALNRDPDQGGLNNFVNALNSGTSWSTVVNAIFSSPEFSNLVPSICSISSPNYHYGSQVPASLPTGSTGYTGSESGLQTALNSAGSGSTVYLAQKAVISMTTTLTIPSGVTLATYGTPSTQQYALMGRLARSITYSGPVVDINGGGKLTSVWVDGQRNVLGSYMPSGGVTDNADIASLGGTGTTVSNNKLSDPQGGTSFYSGGAGDGYPCSHETVTGNMITAYSANHGYSQNSDGLTMRCENIDIENNNIVDVTDIGIILFATNNVTQASTVKNNVILSAGISINGPIAADPTTGANTPGSVLDFSQTTFSTNMFWTGPYTSFDFGIVAGTREWFPSNVDTDGTGVTFTNNTTGPFTARVRAGIAVAGMLNMSISNDGSHPMSFILVTLAPGQPAARCPGGNVIAEKTYGHASGNFPTPDYDGNFDQCI